MELRAWCSMSETNGSGIIYPTIELGGVTYVVKFTRGGLLYRLSKSATNLSDLASGPRSLAAVVDVFHAALFGQYNGTPEELAELVLAEDKLAQVSGIVADSLKKVFPPTQTPAAGTADLTAAAQVQ